MCAQSGILSVEQLKAAPWQERRAIAYPIVLILALVLVLPANRHGPVLHDGFAIDWVWADQFTRELALGHFYPRWMPLSDGGLGSPVFYFYPPLAFYVTGIFGFAGLPTYASVIAAFAAAFAGSGIGCWHWLKGRSNHPLLAAAFFMAAPYHLFDYTFRAVLAESMAIALIPVAAIGLRRIKEGRGGLVLTALAYGAMIATHLPLALLFGIFFLGPFAIVHRQHLRSFAAAAALGIGLAAIYLVPALALERYHDIAQLYRTPSLTTAYWSIYSPHWGNLAYVVVFATVAAIIIAAADPAIRQRDGWARYAIAIAVLVLGAIPFLWSLPLLRSVQFPFRALPLAEFALATALARWPRNAGLPVAIAPALLLSLTIVPGFNLTPDKLQYLQSYHPDTYEYLPKGVMAPGQTSARLQDLLAARLPPPHVSGMVVEPHFYFPSWSCGRPESRTELLMHEPTCAPHIIWTAAEKIGAAISLLAAFLLGALCLRLHWWPLRPTRSSSVSAAPGQIR